MRFEAIMTSNDLKITSLNLVGREQNHVIFARIAVESPKIVRFQNGQRFWNPKTLGILGSKACTQAFTYLYNMDSYLQLPFRNPHHVPVEIPQVAKALFIVFFLSNPFWWFARMNIMNHHEWNNNIVLFKNLHLQG